MLVRFHNVLHPSPSSSNSEGCLQVYISMYMCTDFFLYFTLKVQENTVFFVSDCSLRKNLEGCEALAIRIAENQSGLPCKSSI